MRSVWALTKLFAVDPATASRRVLDMALPVNVSVLLIVLCGVLSGVMAAITVALFGTPSDVMITPDGTEVTITQLPPIVIGLISALGGLVFSYLLFWIGVRSEGRGSLADIFAVTATLQVALTVLGVLLVGMQIVLPIGASLFGVFIVIISLRGLGHALKEGHQFEKMGRSIMVVLASIALSSVVMALAMVVLIMMFGPSAIGVSI